MRSRLPLHYLIPFCFTGGMNCSFAAENLQGVPFTESPLPAGFTVPAAGNIGAYPFPGDPVPSAEVNGTVVLLAESAIAYSGATSEAFPVSNEYFKALARARTDEGTLYRRDQTGAVELGQGVWYIKFPGVIDSGTGLPVATN